MDSKIKRVIKDNIENCVAGFVSLAGPNRAGGANATRQCAGAQIS